MRRRWSCEAFQLHQGCPDRRSHGCWSLHPAVVSVSYAMGFLYFSLAPVQWVWINLLSFIWPLCAFCVQTHAVQLSVWSNFTKARMFLGVSAVSSAKEGNSLNVDDFFTLSGGFQKSREHLGTSGVMIPYLKHGMTWCHPLDRQLPREILYSLPQRCGGFLKWGYPQMDGL